MRQDLSTYEATAISKLNLKGRAESLLSTIDLRLTRIDAGAEHAEPKLNDFLESVATVVG